MKTSPRLQHGTALIELALITPLLLLLTFMATEFGRAMYEYNAVVKSTRDAVRYLSVQTPGTRVTEARNLIVYGNTAGTGARLARGLTLSNVPSGSCCTWQSSGANPIITTVTVRVSSYTFHSLFPSVIGVVFANANGDIVFSEISATMRAPS
ncbi:MULTISPECIES: TadE/TadG family type IV pilus assembly protein [unclassified Variovorax]|jgi:Flp pilus assembly protein TadG|uniref:TadE/TadG family type IV pilus assembly protein n=1 Tax=unclassified Variovorax TaxID=663243 RepID=UPI0008B13008|nr:MULTISPECIES: TadE/TadG family type IV pilus assembly protein [unclassified Variovorax]SEK16478.1 TadE-like protein [Variovorax sp. OK202]SFE49048.1 TadE-like protein [Variovorax sp. OK212]